MKSERTCPVHGLALRPWHRVGKVECPDSACMYVEPHICEEQRDFLDSHDCDCPNLATAHYTARLKPACEGCHIVKDGSPIIAETDGRIQAGDHQCTGKCFDRSEWSTFARAFLALAATACSGAPFTLADTIDAQPFTVENPIDAPIQTDAATEAPPVGVANVRELLDAQGDSRDSGSSRTVVDSADEPDTIAQAREADSGAPIADTGVEVEAQAESGSVETSVEACPPPPVAPDGYSNICATAPARGSSIIQTFPGECACNWTCACLMTSSVCQGLGTPASCKIVNGATCNSVVVAVVLCQ